MYHKQKINFLYAILTGVFFSLLSVSPVFADVLPQFLVDNNNSNFTLVPNVYQVMTWSTIRTDSTNAFSGNRFNPKIAGNYFIQAQIGCPDNISYCVVRLDRDGSPYQYGSYTSAGGVNQVQRVTAFVYMNGTTDYLETSVYSGGGTYINGSTVLTSFSGYFISPTYAVESVSNVDNPVLDLWLGLWLCFAVMVFIIWFFKKSQR